MNKYKTNLRNVTFEYLKNIHLWDHSLNNSNHRLRCRQVNMGSAKSKIKIDAAKEQMYQGKLALSHEKDNDNEKDNDKHEKGNDKEHDEEDSEEDSEEDNKEENDEKNEKDDEKVKTLQCTYYKMGRDECKEMVVPTLLNTCSGSCAGWSDDFGNTRINPQSCLEYKYNMKAYCNFHCTVLKSCESETQNTSLPSAELEMHTNNTCASKFCGKCIYKNLFLTCLCGKIICCHELCIERHRNMSCTLCKENCCRLTETEITYYYNGEFKIEKKFVCDGCINIYTKDTREYKMNLTGKYTEIAEDGRIQCIKCGRPNFRKGIVCTTCRKCRHCGDCKECIKAHLLDKLMGACWIGKLKNVKYILRKGIDPNLISDGQSDMKPAILQACHYNNPESIEIMKELIKFGANVDAMTVDEDVTRRKWQSNALHRCVQSGQFEKVQLLIENGADPFRLMFDENSFQYALSQFIYYRDSLHFDKCNPSDYGLKKSPHSPNDNAYDDHWENTTNYGKVVWYLQGKFPSGFTPLQRLYLDDIKNICLVCKMHAIF